MLWSSLGVHELESNKLYFHGCHFKLQLETKLATYLRDRKHPLTRQNIFDYVSRIKRISYNYGGSWYSTDHFKNVRTSTEHDVAEIIEIGNVIRSYPDLKYTVEDIHIRLFSDNEQELFQIASKIKANLSRNLFNAYVWKPSSEIRQIIDQGYEILSRDPGYSHKIMLRERAIGAEKKLQIYNYLSSLGDLVKISPGVHRMLQNRSIYLYAAWFRTNDTSISTFLELIEPGIIQKIVPIYVKNK